MKLGLIAWFWLKTMKTTRGVCVCNLIFYSAQMANNALMCCQRTALTAVYRRSYFPPRFAALLSTLQDSTPPFFFKHNFGRVWEFTTLKHNNVLLTIWNFIFNSIQNRFKCLLYIWFSWHRNPTLNLVNNHHNYAIVDWTNNSIFNLIIFEIQH